MNVINVLLRSLLIIFLCASSTFLWSQSDSVTITIGSKISLPSKVLNEERTILIHTPPNYNQDSLTCPVIYLFDGQWYFNQVSMTVDYLSKRMKIPPLIVVGIINSNRLKDLKPKLSFIDTEGDSDSSYLRPSVNDFFEFLQQELIPYVDSNYRTQPFRILAGHSLGALFATSVLIESPEIFNSYILISAAFYGEMLEIIERLGKFLSNHSNLNKSLFVAVGSEWSEIHQGVDSLVSQLKNFAPESVRWSYKKYPDEDHNSVPYLSMYDGLRFIFANWPIDVTDSIRVATFDMLKDHYKSLSMEIGYVVSPPENVVEIFGYELLYTRNKVNEAIEVFKENVTNHPTSYRSFEYLGEAFMINGQKDLAIENFEKSLSLNPNNERVKGMLSKCR